MSQIKSKLSLGKYMFKYKPIKTMPVEFWAAFFLSIEMRIINGIHKNVIQIETNRNLIENFELKA